MNWKDKTIFIGDNLHIMRGLNSDSVDLIYLDPPFNSNGNYAAPIGSQAAGAAFKDTWPLNDIDIAEHGELAEQVPPLYTVIQAARAAHGKGMQSYLIMMSTRLLEMERILKDTGSIYLHCDPTASHYLKLVMDGIFGKGNFRAEIAWHYSGGNARLSKSFSSRHDVILFYGKSDKQNRSSIDIALLWSEGLSIKSSCESLNLQNPDSDNNPCNPRHPFNPRFRQYNKKSLMLKNRPKKPNFSQVLQLPVS